jgi:phosphonate ABC transporter permease subunit PhnE
MADIPTEVIGEKSSRKQLLRGLIIGILIFLVYAFAVQATQIDLEKPLDPGRQENVTRVLRLLADPDIVSVDDETGSWGLSEATRITIERIIETIFMALLASTIGTALAVPVSFLAARNLMEDVTAPLAAIMAGVIALPIGGFIGLQIARTSGALAERAADFSLWAAGAGILVVTGLIWLVMRSGPVDFADTKTEWRGRVFSIVRTAIVLLLGVFGLALLAQIGLIGGAWLEEALGIFGFLGNFVYILADFVQVFLPALLAMLLGFVAASYGSRYGQEAVLSLSTSAARMVTAVLTFFGTAVLIYAAGSFLNWLYEFDHPQNWTTIPALLGGGIAAVVSLFLMPKRPFSVGFAIYTVTRGILNILRSIEPLIMGIVFVVWVSLGPFAGIMALTLHSIAALGKLFSEQVEGIDEGPVEAVTATGANRLQMIAFAVIPQIVPPFTAFALYRWDINVRMSTIIGFVGGGGIGFVLSQNIQQLRYRQASVMMLSIAIVVILLDYASSRIRQRII